MANPFGKSPIIHQDAIINAISVVIMFVPMRVWVSSCGRFVWLLSSIMATVAKCYFLFCPLSHCHYLY